MLNPVEMKNRAAVIDSIRLAEAHFQVEAENLASMKRENLNSRLLTYCERFRRAKAAAVPAAKCLPCGGSGTYQKGTGSCFRCIGKGVQDASDVERNRAYDELRAKRAAAAAAYIPETGDIVVVGNRAHIHNEDDLPEEEPPF